MLEKTMGNGRKKGAHAMEVDEAEHEDKEAAMETTEDRQAQDQATRLQDLAKKVEEFVEGKGDVEGARFAEYACAYLVFSDH
jgi:hypothetical protein